MGQDEGPSEEPRGRVFPLFVPVLWFLGGHEVTSELSADRAALANVIGLLLTGLAVGAVVIAVLALV